MLCTCSPILGSAPSDSASGTPLKYPGWADHSGQLPHGQRREGWTPPPTKMQVIIPTQTPSQLLLQTLQLSGMNPSQSILGAAGLDTAN